MSDSDESNFENLDDLIAKFDNARDNIPKDCLDCLEKVFGHTNFRDMQWKVISSVMKDRRDNCVVMSTGYGKSLCYQFPSIYLNTVTIVVSPLISLMEDQVMALKLNNIEACLLGSAQKDKSIFSEIFIFKYNLIYCTPEFLTGDFGSEFLKKLAPKLQLIAIDEAHCISKWGHDFRSSFRYLNRIRRTVPHVPIMAMTATATESVQLDICKSLELKNPQMLCTGFDRPNLEFQVKEKSKQGVWSDIGLIIKSVRIGSIIIYCLTRRFTETVCGILQSHSVNCAAYHAGLTINQRKIVHEDFVKDKVQVIVATIAFGMGIDKPDVRLVMHYGVARDVESYYQEIGRAGRDGMPAKCFMFHNRSDFTIHEGFIEKSCTTNEFKESLKKLSMKMKEYVNILGCRREFIINYFENNLDNFHKKLKNCCDNCNANKSDEYLSNIYENIADNGNYDFSCDAENLFKSIEVFNGTKGLIVIISFLLGAKRRTLNEIYYKHHFFGCGKDKTKEYYKLLVDLLELNNYIDRKSISNNYGQKQKFYNNAKVLGITEKGKNWLKGLNRKPILLKPNKSLLKFMKRKPIALNINSPIENNTQIVKRSVNTRSLWADLLKVRGAIARQMDVMPYMVLSNKALHQLVQKCPLSLDAVRAAKLDGFSDAKIIKFGPSFLKCVLKYKSFLPDSDASNEKKCLRDYLANCPLVNAKPLTVTLLTTYDLFKSGKSLIEISQIRRLALSTITNYFNDIIKNGLIFSKLDLRKLGILEHNFKIISDKLKSFDLDTVKLTEIKEVCPETVNYDNIKLVLSYYQLRKHIKNNQIPFEDPDTVIKCNSDSDNKIIYNIHPTGSTSIAVNEEDTPQYSGNSCSRMNSISYNVNNVKEEEDAAESIDWDSEDDFTFEQIDEDIKKFNNSITQKSNEDEELDLLIKDIENQNSNIEILNKIKSKDQPVKRKIIFKPQKSSVIYLDDCSEDDSENKSEEPQIKRKVPEWLTKSERK